MSSGVSVLGKWVAQLAAAGLLLLASAPARAQVPTCEPLDSVRFGTLVYAAQDAIDRAEPEVHESIVNELRTSLPCLSFAPTPRQWANYLVVEALLEFLQGGDWQSPIVAARALWPTVDLQVGSRHPIAQFEGQHEQGEPVAVSDITLYVDGERTEVLPTRGLHLIQRQDGERWRSLVMNDSPVDLSALRAPFPHQPERRWAFQLNGVAGLGGGAQRRVKWKVERGAGDPVIPEENWLSAWPALTARAFVAQDRLAGGAHVEVGLPRLADVQLSAGEVFVGYAAAGGTLVAVGPGVGSAGLFELSTVDGAAERRVIPRPYGVLVIESRRTKSDVGFTAGLGGGVAKLALFGGVLRAPKDVGSPLRIGLSTDAIAGRFGQPLPGGLQGGELWSLSWRAGVEIGIARRR